MQFVPTKHVVLIIVAFVSLVIAIDHDAYLTKKMRNLFKTFKEYLLIFFCLIYILLLIYYKFLRQRLPQNLPFNLTELRFYSLCILCLVYIYIIVRVLYPKPPSYFVIYLLNIITKPLVQFITLLKKYGFTIYYDLWRHVVPILDNWTLYDNVLFYFILSIIPRIILLIIFVVDIFYVNNIEAFYYFIFLGIFPLLYILFIKYLENIVEEYIQMVESLYTDVALFEEGNDALDYIKNPKAVYHDTRVTVRKYIEIQYEAFITYGDDNEYIEYYGYPFFSDLHYEEYKRKYNKPLTELTYNDYDLLHEKFHYIMPKIIILKIFLDYNTKNATKYSYIFEINLLILLMYLLCWIYILIISFSTLKDLVYTLQFLELLLKYIIIWEPFSDTTL